MIKTAAKLCFILLSTLVVSACGTLDILKTIDVNSSYELVYENKDYKVEQRIESEYNGGVTGFVFGSERTYYYPFFKISAKNNHARNNIRGVTVKYSCYDNLSRGTKYIEVIRLTLKPSDLDKEIESDEDISGTYKDSGCNLKPVDVEFY